MIVLNISILSLSLSLSIHKYIYIYLFIYIIQCYWRYVILLFFLYGFLIDVEQLLHLCCSSFLLILCVSDFRHLHKTITDLLYIFFNKKRLRRNYCYIFDDFSSNIRVFITHVIVCISFSIKRASGGNDVTCCMTFLHKHDFYKKWFVVYPVL